jgi:hypothetical protein
MVILVLLIALVPIILSMYLLQEFLFFTIVSPTITNRGIRFWINAIAGGTQGKHTKQYLASLPPERRAEWPNWYLANATYLIGFTIAAWIAILLFAR